MSHHSHDIVPTQTRSGDLGRSYARGALTQIQERRTRFFRRNLGRQLKMWGFISPFCSQFSKTQKYSHIDRILVDLNNWPRLSHIQLTTLLRDLRISTEKDGIDGQYCRTAAFAIVPKLAEILHYYSTQPATESIPVISEALACVRFVTKGEGTNISMATKCGVLAICRDIMHNFSKSDEIQRFCCMVFRSLTFNRADNQLHVVQIGVVPLILQSMKNFPFDPLVQSAALMSLQNITWLVEENRTAVEREGGIQHIMTAMTLHHQNVEVQKWACGALQNLACCVRCTVQLINTGAVEIVLTAMKNHLCDATVQNYGLGVLRNICYLKDNRARVAGSGAIKIALTAMSAHLEDLEVQNSACSFFFNTVIDVDVNGKRLLHNPEALPTIFASKCAHAHEVRFVDKTNALLDQLGKYSHGIYIDLNIPQGPLSLKELCLRETVKQSNITPSLPENIVEDSLQARQCTHCANTFVRNFMTIAAKAKDNNWSYHQLCGRLCANDVIRIAVSAHSSTTPEAIPHGSGN